MLFGILRAFVFRNPVSDKIFWIGYLKLVYPFVNLTIWNPLPHDASLQHPPQPPLFSDPIMCYLPALRPFLIYGNDSSTKHAFSTIFLATTWICRILLSRFERRVRQKKNAPATSPSLSPAFAPKVTLLIWRMTTNYTITAGSVAPKILPSPPKLTNVDQNSKRYFVRWWL